MRLDKKAEGGFMETIMALMAVIVALTVFVGSLAYIEYGDEMKMYEKFNDSEIVDSLMTSITESELFASGEIAEVAEGMLALDVNDQEVFDRMTEDMVAELDCSGVWLKIGCAGFDNCVVESESGMRTDTVVFSTETFFSQTYENGMTLNFTIEAVVWN